MEGRYRERERDGKRRVEKSGNKIGRMEGVEGGSGNGETENRKSKENKNGSGVRKKRR